MVNLILFVIKSYYFQKSLSHHKNFKSQNSPVFNKEINKEENKKISKKPTRSRKSNEENKTVQLLLENCLFSKTIYS